MSSKKSKTSKGTKKHVPKSYTSKGSSKSHNTSKSYISKGSSKSHNTKVTNKKSLHKGHEKKPKKKIRKDDSDDEEEKNEESDDDSDDDETKCVRADGQKLRLKRFNIKWIHEISPSPTIAMIAKRGSGKSTAIRAIMDYYKDIPGGNIISRTDRMDPFFREFFPDLFIFYEYASDIVQNLLDRQEFIKEKNDNRKKKKKTQIDTRAWLVMDDCLSQKKKWEKDEPIKEVFENGRHYDLFYILTMQYPLGLGPSFRDNFDLIFIFGANFLNIKKTIFDNYTGMFDTFEIFNAVFKKCTVNYGCMVINNRTKSDKIEDIVYWWRAPTKKIKELIGHKTFVRHHHEKYDKKYRKKLAKKKEAFNFLPKKKNKPDILVDLIE